MVDTVIDRKEWNAHLDAFEAQSTHLRHTVAMPEDFASLVEEALHGDPDADMILIARAEFVSRLNGAPRGSGVTCAICPTILRPRQFAFGLALPLGVDKPSNGFVFGLCHRCAPDRTAAEAAALRALLAIWPGAVPQLIHPGVGNA